MKLIKPSFEILVQEPKLEGLLKHIELCGRTAYKSEDLITEDSAPKFVDMLIKRSHGAVLEHGTVYLSVPFKQGHKSNNDAYWYWDKYRANKYSIAKQIETVFKPKHSEGFVAITTNYRVLIENDWLDDLQYQCEATESHEKRISIKFICDRGISHEFVRHRVFSFVQESTRYCNYSKAKFNNELTFIEPFWLKDIEEEWHEFGDHQMERLDSAANYIEQLEFAEESYLQLLRKGWTPQQARSVLPNSLKTELIMTGTVEQWEGFFKLRCAVDAHPQARELAVPLEQEFKKWNYA